MLRAGTALKSGYFTEYVTKFHPGVAESTESFVITVNSFIFVPLRLVSYDTRWWGVELVLCNKVYFTPDVKYI